MLTNSNITSQDASNLNRLPRVENVDMAHEFNYFMTSNMQYFNSYFSGKIPILANPEKNILEVKRKAPVAIREQVLEPDTFSFLNTSIYTTPEFKLLLTKTPPTTLCKGKYFTFKVLLKGMTEISFPANEKIELEVLVYSQDDILITKNMKGKEILRGNFIQNMSYFTMEEMHVAYFRVQLTEVSSHYLGKTLKLKIQARKSEFIRATGWKIQSICLSDIVVKAKDIVTRKRNPSSLITI